MKKIISNFLITAGVCLSLGTLSSYAGSIVNANGSLKGISPGFQDTIPRNPANGSNQTGQGHSKNRGTGTMSKSNSTGTKKETNPNGTMGQTKSGQNSDNRGEGNKNNRSGNKKSTDSTRRG